MRVVGVDFGAKLSGTTSICFVEDNTVKFLTSKKGENSDEFILNHLKNINPEIIGIDAPLSIPAAYQLGSASNDFSFRLADRQLHAMSPMFLGGLTARAVSLAVTLRAQGIEVIEVYPRAFVRLLTEHEELYVRLKRTKDPVGMESLAEKVTTKFNFGLHITTPGNWHEFDSMLAFLSAVRFKQGEAARYGDPEEGLIYV
jgi:predicted nuclease with RNAse H fold